MKRIINILKSNGPMLSGDIATKLVEQYGISTVAARKVISRTNPPIRKLKNINFDNNQKFLYLEEQFNQEEYLSSIIECMKKQSKAYYSFIQAMIYHNGFLTKNQLCTYTFSPINPLKGHRLAEQLLENLCAIQLINKYNDEIFQLNPLLWELNYRKYHAVELAKKITITNFYDWAKSINITAYSSGKMFPDSPEFFKFQWGFTSPSYIGGIKKNRNSPPLCFVIADILMGKDLDDDSVMFFINKIDILRQQKKIIPFIPILITDSVIDKSTFKSLKSKGIVLGFVDKLFGNSYAESLKSLVHIVEHASAVIARNPDDYFKLLENLSVLNGNTNNLKGDLFELTVGYYYSQTAQYFEINKNIHDYDSGKNKEIDVFVRYSHNEIRIVECKGHNYPLEEEHTKKWLTDNIPVIRNWLLSQDDYHNKQIVFELWSTGGYDNNSLKILQEHSNKVKKYIIKYFDKNDILKMFRESKNSNIQKIIKNHF